MRFQNSTDESQIWLSTNDTYHWAHRAGNLWPGSTLSGKRVFATFASNGDLLDYTINGRHCRSVDATEFNAMMDDFMAENGAN